MLFVMLALLNAGILMMVAAYYNVSPFKVIDAFLTGKTLATE